MNNKLTFVIGLILCLIMPILAAYIIGKLFAKNNGKALTIIFITLIVLEIIAVVIKIIKYKKIIHQEENKL